MTHTPIQKNMVIGLGDRSGDLAVVLQLFPVAIARVMAAAEWAKSHPDVKYIPVTLHGEAPTALVITMERTDLFAMVIDILQSNQYEYGATLQ
ncbi:hypothetical protein A4U49_09560 [Acidithiobacillus ferrivorans]|jgi:hypothetical protein|uniref:hypothetical protein n=1 Tax=Acidithiobacillus ferrivorans TaxID=160808 RepID=UPI000892DF46|nr:hypothetical protein [Acidithiobacillus ferrivorans]OFA16000.1 hypothetical protein A4U49_09560 [Acidithiobacillus ferrivorans]